MEYTTKGTVMHKFQFACCHNSHLYILTNEIKHIAHMFCYFLKLALSYQLSKKKLKLHQLVYHTYDD